MWFMAKKIQSKKGRKQATTISTATSITQHTTHSYADKRQQQLSHSSLSNGFIASAMWERVSTIWCIWNTHYAPKPAYCDTETRLQSNKEHCTNNTRRPNLTNKNKYQTLIECVSKAVTSYEFCAEQNI